MTSARFTALATTSRRTCPGPGSGSGTSVHSRTSGSPGSRITMACIQITLPGRAGVVVAAEGPGSPANRGEVAVRLWMRGKGPQVSCREAIADQTPELIYTGMAEGRNSVAKNDHDGRS